MADYRLTQSGDEVQNTLNNAAMRAQLNAETERATTAEQQLQANIGSEAQTRQQADTTLQQHIDSEAQTRQQADAALNQLIQQVQASLINYYLKTETYSANQIDQMLAAIKQFRYQVVDELPTPSADTMGIIYLVPSAHAVSGNIKDEYITLTRDEGSGIIYYFEQIGETAIDLSNYYTKAQTNAEISAAINAALAAYYTSTQTDAAIAAAIATAIANYYTKSQVDALIANFITASVNNLVNYYLKSETFTKAEVNQLIAAVQQFTYQSVTTLPTASADTMSKIYLVPSTNPETKNVKDEYITIATTDQGTTTYSWEQIGTTTVDLSGYSTTEQMNAAIATAISTALANYYTKSQTMTSAEIEAAISAALLTYSTTSEMNTAIINAINTALASYSTTSQMTAAIATAIANYYTKAEVDALIANFITKSVNDLVNYYLKSDTYTKAEVQQLIDAIKQFTYVSVAELPTASADTMNKIYLVPSTNPETKNVKDEYITIAVTDQGTTTYSWEQIGTTTVDLSGYYTSQQTDAAISNALNTALASYSTTSQMTAAIATAIANYYTKTEVDALIANFITKSVNDLVNYYLKSDTYTKAEVQQLIDAVKQFTYVSVAELPTASADTMNKIYLVPSTNPETKNVKDEYITIAVTDQGTTTYSWEQIGTTTVDLSGYYTSQQTDAAISAALNTALSSYSTTSQMTAAIATAIANYYTKSQVDALIANFITASTQNLAYYYLKSETYSASEVDQLLAAVKQFTYEAVAVLPEASAQTVGKIYLVPSADPKTQNTKDEFITLTTIEEGTTTYYWECIGSTTIDLSSYYTKTQTDSAITAALNNALAAYSTTTQVGTMISSAINSALQAYATKEYVSGQVQEYAGTFRGTYDTLVELEATTGNHHNDYAWVKVTDSDGDNDYDRYKYNGSAWVFEYRLNNTHFTADELASIRSGMTTAKREKLDALPTNADLNTKFYALTRHTRLTDFDLNILKQAVADQNLEKYGLKPGDQKTINGHTYVIAGLNPMKGTSTPYRVTANHVGLIVIPHTTQAWNASGNTSTGADNRGAGYMNCDLHYYLKNTLLPLVETDLGAANLIGHSKLLTNAVNTTGINRYGEATGCSSGWGWEAGCKICALSEVQVYGSIVWSSSGYDTGEACRQLDVFQTYSHTEIFGGENPWLRDVVSASHAAPAYSYGHAANYAASHAIYVAALILFH